MFSFKMFSIIFLCFLKFVHSTKFVDLMNKDLNYEDVLKYQNFKLSENTEVEKIFNFTQNSYQHRLLFINKFQQNKNFIINNHKKFTHFSPKWFQFSLLNDIIENRIKQYLDYFKENFILDDLFLNEENSIEIVGEDKIDFDFIKDVREINPSIKIIPTLKLVNTTEKDILNILTDNLISEFMTKQLVSFCKLYDFDGIVIDMWTRFPLKSKSELWKVYRDLGESFKKNKLQFFILIPPPKNNKNEIGFFTKQDTEQLAPYVDGFVLNTFDFSTDEIPGPIQPINWLAECVNILVPRQKSPVRSKILIGLKLHGNIYTPNQMKTLSSKVYLKLLKKHKPKLIWNNIWFEHYFNYKEHNTINRAYFPTLASLKERLLLIKNLNCGLASQYIEKGMPIFQNLLTDMDRI